MLFQCVYFFFPHSSWFSPPSRTSSLALPTNVCVCEWTILLLCMVIQGAEVTCFFSGKALLFYAGTRVFIRKFSHIHKNIASLNPAPPHHGLKFHGTSSPNHTPTFTGSCHQPPLSDWNSKTSENNATDNVFPCLLPFTSHPISSSHWWHKAWKNNPRFYPLCHWHVLCAFLLRSTWF